MRKRTGLTLMELVLVLTILAVLGGLVIAVLPSVTKRTHLAKCSDTIAQLNTSWMRAYALNVRYPDTYDSLLGTGGSSIDARLTPALSGMLTPYSLTPADVAALQGVGITRVVDLGAVPTGGSVTYDSAPLGAAARVLASGGSVAELNLAAYMAAGNQLSLKRHLIRQPDGSMADNSANVRYLVFGLGANCSGVGTGKLIQEAPVHFGALDQINPTAVYQRYLIIFSLATDAKGALTVNFEAAAGNDVIGPSSAEGHIRQFHDDSSRDG